MIKTRTMMLALALAGAIAGCGSTPSGAEDMLPGNVDMASAGDAAGGMKQFGDTCTGDADCMSGMCRPFAMMTVNRCTKPCTVATQATDCPAPSNGTCTPNLYCRFLQ